MKYNINYYCYLSNTRNQLKINNFTFNILYINIIILDM